MSTHTNNAFAWALRDVRLAFRRKDCDEARYLVQTMARRPLTAAQRRTVLRLQHAVTVCERRVPDLGAARRRRRS